MATKRRSAVSKVLRVAGGIAGATVTFTFAAVGAVVLHLDVPAVRRLVASQASGILTGTFAGTIEIQRIGHLGLGGIDGTRVQIKDPDGVPVLFVDGARVRIDAIDAARSALLEKGDIRIRLPEIKIDHVDGAIDGRPDGQLRLGAAFASRHPSPPSDKPGRKVRLDFDDARLGHAWVHGTPPGAIPVDAEVRALVAHAKIHPEGITADLDHVDLVTRGLPRHADPSGAIAGHFAMPTGKDPTIVASFDGEAAEIQIVADGSYDGKRVDARLEGHDARGAGIRALSEMPIDDELLLHVEAHGDLPHVDARASLGLGRAAVGVQASIDTGPTTRVNAAAYARHVDAKRIAEGAPATDLGLDARAVAAIGPNGPEVDLELTTVPGKVESDPVPRLQVVGTMSAAGMQALARIDDASMPTQVAVLATPKRGEPLKEIEARVWSRIPDLRRVPKLGGSIAGSAAVDATAKVDLAAKTIDAQAAISGRQIAAAGNKVGNVGATVKASGSLDRPTLDVDVEAKEIAAGKIAVTRAGGKATVEAGSPLVVRDVAMDALSRNVFLKLATRRVEVGRQELVVEGVKLEGLGEPIEAEISKTANDLHVKAEAPSIDLTKVGFILQEEHVAGKVSLDANVLLSRTGAVGAVHANATAVSVLAIKGGGMKLDARFDERDVTADLGLALGDAGKIVVSAKDVHLGGAPIDVASWKRAAGRATLDGDVDFTKLAGILPQGALPIGDLGGRLVVSGMVGRRTADVAPDVRLHFHTLGLYATGPSRPEAAHGDVRVAGAAPWTIRDVDLGFDARVDAESGQTEVALHATDSKGALVAIDGKAFLPYAAIMANPQDAQALAMAAPAHLSVVVPKRKLGELPAVFGTQDIAGTLDAALDVSGTVLDPKVDFAVHGRGVQSPRIPIAGDGDVVLAYDGKAADLDVKMRSKDKDLLTLSSHVDVKASDVLRAHGKEIPWDGSMKAKLASFPLESIGPLQDRRIRGNVTGDITLDDLHKDAKAHAKINLAGLRVGKARYETGEVNVDAADGKLVATAKLTQTDGFLDARAETGLQWGARVAPELDTGKPVQAKLTAKAFRAAALQPFVEGAIGTIDGRIEANATAELTPGGGAKMDGNVEFHDGTVQVVALGDELTNVHAKVAFSPDGTVKLTEVRAKGTEGEINASGEAKLEGTKLASASAKVSIPEKKPIDLDVEGQPIGSVYGEVAVNAKTAGNSTTLGIDVPKFHVKLPQTIKSGVQQLEARKDVRVGTFRPGHRFVMLPLDKQDLKPPKEASPGGELAIEVKVGELTVDKPNQAHVVITGNPRIQTGGDQTKITGQISVKDGWADVQGKKFVVEKGTITFNGASPPNPVVIATATWTAQDETKIFADFTGPVKTGKVRLRSEPARPENEILATILFGTPDGAAGAPAPGDKSGSDPTKTAAGIGGGFAAQGLTEALDDLAGIQATARIDTTESNNPKPEIEFQVSPRVSLTLAHILGEPPVTEPPDRNLTTLGYHFSARWSLETTVGDRGQGLVDAVWQKRY